MNLENIKAILPFLAPTLGLFCTTIVFLKKFIKNKKVKKVLEKTEEITREIIPYIIEAERFTNYTGEEKKNFVMTKLNQFAIDNDIKFNKEETSSKIEELVDLTKNVNVKNTTSSPNDVSLYNSKSDIEKKIQDIIEGLAR